MKHLLFIFLFLFSGLVRADLLCLPAEYGGDGLDLTVGTTTSGTWYAWNCVSTATANRIQLVAPEGIVIVKGHKPSAACAAAGFNPFVEFNKIYSLCYGYTAEEKVKFNRLLKSLETAKSKLPTSYP
jgi:hypothetical protein